MIDKHVIQALKIEMQELIRESPLLGEILNRGPVEQSPLANVDTKELVWEIIKRMRSEKEGEMMMNESYVISDMQNRTYRFRFENYFTGAE